MKYSLKKCFGKKLLLLVLLMVAALFLPQDVSIANAKVNNQKNYLVTPDTTPLNTKYIYYGSYNGYTRNYYMLRSYLEQLEEDGGGTLTLSPGTYTISNTLYVPSNVTISFQDGVYIKKQKTTGIEGFRSSKCIFTLAAPSKSNVKGAYSGYNGETNIKLLGTGKVVFDLDFDLDCLAVTLGHNTNVSISGITFQNMRSGHFIEMDASRNVMIDNNTFIHHKASSSGIKEAINIDTPDVNTNGFHVIWTSYDCTPDKDVIIRNNHFEDLERAIGTHKYSQNKYHENIHILYNEITNTNNDAIRILNWKNPIIRGNTIQMVAGGKGSNKRAILASGVLNPIITDNKFMYTPRPIQIFPWKNTGSGKNYDVTYNDITWNNITLMLKNTLVNVDEKYIRISSKYNEYKRYTNKYFYQNKYIENLKQ
jgi:hypothetical protein